MIDVAEGRRLKAAADVELLAYVATATECGPEHEGHQESWNAVSRANASWVGWITANIAALLDAAERAEAAERELAEARAKIDALMLEYCPDEMTPGQVDEWARHQRPIDAEQGK